MRLAVWFPLVCVRLALCPPRLVACLDQLGGCLLLAPLDCILAGDKGHSLMVGSFASSSWWCCWCRER